MENRTQTLITPLRVKQNEVWTDAAQKPAEIVWQAESEITRGQSMLKNLGVAAALVLCAVTLRTGAIPSLSDAADAVLTAATDQSLLDDQLGKLSFVGALFPETVLVFGEEVLETMASPVSGGMVVHTWTKEEPYTSMRSSSQTVMAAYDGEVSGIYHGNADERLIQISLDNGMTCVYGNLGNVMVATGDAVKAGEVVGELIPGTDLVFELRHNGVSMNPSAYFVQ